MPSPSSLLRAKSLSRSVLRSALDAEAAVAANKEQRAHDAKQDRERLASVAQCRTQENLKIIKCNEDRIIGSDDAIKQAASCLRSLQHARYAHFAATQVCERRLELRQERPPKVHGRSLAPSDAVQESLEMQHQVLTAARQSLLQLEDQTRSLLKELGGVRGRLSKDAAQRRLAVELDRAWVISLSSISVAASSQFPPPPPQPAELGSLGPGESHALCQHVFELEGSVRDLKSQALASIHRYKDEARRAHVRVEELLMRSTYALDELGRRLKEQAKEVDGTIKHAGRSMHETKKNLQKNDHVGASKIEALAGLIHDLQTTRQELQEDINMKAALLNIDERCRKVTPAMASEKRTSVASRFREGNQERAFAKTASTSLLGTRPLQSECDAPVACTRVGPTA